MSLIVNEIFNSFQGEGRWSGRYGTFVRLQGCNLKCKFCDTKDSWRTEGLKMSTKEIVDKCLDFIIITGGEPLLQEGVFDLIDALRDKDKFVAIETNATIGKAIPGHVWVTASPKPPLYEKNVYADEVKLVVDSNLTKKTIYTFTEKSHNPVYLQPESNKPESIEKAMTLIRELRCEHLLLGLQSHKIWEVQ